MPTSSSSSEPLTYARYLKVPELLALQQPLSEGPEHDEMLFIVIHQVYELWFKQLLHETEALRASLAAGAQHDACATLRRLRTIMKTLVAQVDILETMTPVSFQSFRDRLESASGFQSYQFREFEFACGHKRRAILEHHPPESPGRAPLERRWGEPTLYDAFLRFLAGAGYDVPAALLERDVTAPVEPTPALHASLLAAYRSDPATRQVCELLVDLDEGIQEWRYRHVKMVERTIGFKSGTGGSAGAAYLRETLFRPLFPDLWAIRTEL